MKTACVQLGASDDKDKNVKKALNLVKQAIARGAKFVALPEVFTYRGKLADPFVRRHVVESAPFPSLKGFGALARAKNVHILAGSLYEQSPDGKKIFNTSCLIGPNGRIKAVYRKINLFKADLGGKKIDESENFAAGNKEVLARVEDFKVGLSVCYDLRFPVMFRRYASAGAHVLCVPSAFTYKTGQMHWEILLRARAIENLSFVLAPNQIGIDHSGVKFYGNSMIVDPWGNILAKASTAKEEIIYADLDLNEVKQARAFLPNVLSN